MPTVQTTSIIASLNIGIVLINPDDIFYLLGGLQIVNTNSAAAASGAVFVGGGKIVTFGTIAGATFGISSSTLDNVTDTVEVGSGGSVVGSVGVNSSNATVAWNLIVDPRGSVLGATDGFDFNGTAKVSVFGSLTGSTGAGIQDLASGARSNSLLVGGGGLVYGGAFGLQSANAASAWTVNVAAGGQIASGGSGVSLSGSASINVAGTINAGADAVVSTNGGVNSLIVSSGGSLVGGADGLRDENSSADWRVRVDAGGSISGETDGVNVAGSGVFTVLGSVAGGLGGNGVTAGGDGKRTQVYVGSNGSISSPSRNGLALTGVYEIENHGQIAGGGGYNGVVLAGSGILTNFGVIGGGSDTSITYGVYDIGGSVSDVGKFVNYGVVSGSYAYMINSSRSWVLNFGVMNGSVRLGEASGSQFDSSGGSVNGAIQCSSGGSIVVAGNTGGGVYGAIGADLLYANRTQIAADNAASTTLDGAGGNNALYGGGGFTTFVAGTAAGGTNQIWGGLSQMAGVDGYANNTISFASDGGRGVLVDLLNGHNAFVTTNPGNWGAPFRFEDWIAQTSATLSSVPNVIGSSARDSILCDAGIDRIAGGGGGDSLYAGSGASSRDTFVYDGYGDSNLTTGYDTIVGFKRGIDRIDISGFMQTNGLSGASLKIFTSGASNTVYVQKTPGALNAATDLAMVVATSTVGGLTAGDFVF